MNWTTKPVARKQRGCYWCPEPILVKERYVREAGTFNGDFFSAAFHPECREAIHPDGNEWCAMRDHVRGGACDD